MEYDYTKKFECTLIGNESDEKAIARFEEVLGVSLPNDYREFLMKWNGLHVSGRRVVYPLQSVAGKDTSNLSWSEWRPEIVKTLGGDIGDLWYLYGLLQEGSDTLLADDERYGFKLWVPDRFLAIGAPAFEIGNICISLSGEDRGEIYFWLHPEDVPEPGVNCPNLDFMDWIAPSFYDFWKLLREVDDDEWDLWKSIDVVS